MRKSSNTSIGTENMQVARQLGGDQLETGGSQSQR